ncbi:MAG: DmsC/YnfH family molybdoenzyme membrane anchor subunit [Pseudomonadota bacterium]
MHPAHSIIIFTVTSGLGFGLLAFLGLGQPAVTGWAAFWYFALAFALSVGGLVSSTFHLGNPQRAWRAFSQWRSSWLSREGVLAVVTLAIMGIYAIFAVFFGQIMPVLGIIGAVMALATVFATSMIYAQMKTVPRWHHWMVPALFMALAVAGGALLTGHALLAVILLFVAGVLQTASWSRGDRALADSGSTLGTATGLGVRGTVRAFEPPHTGNNYLLKEMVHVIGRRHARKLRLIALALMVLAPIVLLLIPGGWTIIALAFAVHLAGTLAQRWLFFAEAEHVVGLYYGKR